jgi:hypothetical protein
MNDKKICRSSISMLNVKKIPAKTPLFGIKKW